MGQLAANGHTRLLMTGLLGKLTPCKRASLIYHCLTFKLGAKMKRGLLARMVLPAIGSILFLMIGVACGGRDEVVVPTAAPATPTTALSPTPTERPEAIPGRSPTDTPVPPPERARDDRANSITELLSQHPWEKYAGDESLPGVYLLLDPENFGAFLELAPDATFLLETVREVYRGEWEAAGDRLVLSSATFEGNVDLPTDIGASGVRWIGMLAP